MIRRGSADQTRQRGAVSITVVLGMTMLLGSAAMAVDMGHMFVVRTESQEVADLAALAGTGAYIQSAAPNIAEAVESWAQQYGLQNSVDRSPVALLASDILPDAINERVSVTVSHTAARGNAIATVFAGVLGINQVDVVTRAAAEASPALGVYCAFPIYLVDRWTELGGDPLRFDAGTDYYEAYDPAFPSSTYTGYDRTSVGVTYDIQPAGGTPADAGRPQQDWYFPHGPNSLPLGPGSYQPAIEGCLDPDLLYEWGGDFGADPTSQLLATLLGFQAVAGQDPSAAWDAAIRCVVDASAVGLGDPTACRSSPRIRPVLLLDPSLAPGSVPQFTPPRNLAGLFISHADGSRVTVILTGYSGVRAARSSGGGVAPPLVRMLRIVE